MNELSTKLSKQQTAQMDGLLPVSCIHYPIELPYVQWFDFAEKQKQKGKEQKKCPICEKWFFPCEFSKKVKTKTVQCQECKHYIFHENRFTTKLFCTLKNKYIRFYKPQFPYDENCGWKCKCADFVKEKDYTARTEFVSNFHCS